MTFLVLVGLLGVASSGMGSADSGVWSDAAEIEVNVIFSGPSLEAFRAMAEAFEQDHPQVEVMVSRPPNLVDVLFSRVKAGNPPTSA